jgi:hypothetical protein
LLSPDFERQLTPIHHINQGGEMRLPSIEITGSLPFRNELEKKVAAKTVTTTPTPPSVAESSSSAQAKAAQARSKATAMKLNLGIAKLHIQHPLSQLDNLLISNNIRDVQAFFKRDGAKDAGKALNQPHVQNVGVLTGFSVGKDANGNILPETDGPIGAVIAGESLRNAGKTVVYVVDTPNLDLLHAALGDAYPGWEDDPKIKIEVFDTKLEKDASAEARTALRTEADNLLTKHKINGLFAVELPSRTVDDRYSNMRGDDINDINSARDEIMLAAHDKNKGKKAREQIVTAGVGDGGNEAGMGNRKGIKKALDGSVMEASVHAKYPVTSWNSNLGACAVGAVIAKLNNNMATFTTPEQLGRMINAVLAAGAVDGCTRSSKSGEVIDTPTGKLVTGVDGKHPEVHKEDLERLIRIVDLEIKPKKEGAFSLLKDAYFSKPSTTTET